MAAFIPSPSAAELWELCNARALGKYVEGIREEPGFPAREGSRLHKLTQKYLVTGRLPAMHEVAVHKIVAALPVPGGSIERSNIERVLVIPEMHGYMDWTTGDGRQGDLKFTSNVRYQRAKDPTSDKQRIAYAHDEFYRDPYLVTLRQTWSVSQFDGKAALKLEHKWTRKAVKKKFRLHLAKTLDDLCEAVEQQKSWRRAKKNYSSCWAFNRECPMIEHGCKRSILDHKSRLTPSERLKL